MVAACRLPVTVKHRLGVDERESFDELLAFVDTVAAAGAERFTVHARKAWLSGLSPKENREIPPLRYEWVHELKRRRRGLVVEINGGLRTLEELAAHLEHVDAAMVGRAAWDDPFAFAGADALLFGDAAPPPTRRAVAERMIGYLATERAKGVFASHVVRPMLGLVVGLPGARAWRRQLSEQGTRAGAGPELIEDALARVPGEVLDAPVARPPSPAQSGAPRG
jgi:tRNA-dihydrouridine synthase A